MAHRSRAERLDRLRGKRKQVYVIALAAVATLAVGAFGIGLAIANHVVPQASSAKAGVLDSMNSGASTLSSTASTSTVPVEIPVLVGMQIAEAEMLLKAAGLTLVRVATPPGDTAAGIVLAQTPSAGERVVAGSLVELIYADPAAATAAAGAASAPDSAANGLVVCIDPGHQGKGNASLEPVGPGATEKKPKVTSGAAGVVTRQSEHAMVLALSLKIKERLERYGVTVIMTRTTAAVDISNSQRAAVANEAGADIFVRVHADSNTNADIRGISTLYAGGNDWVAPIESESLRAAGMVHKQMLTSTGASDRGVVKRADLAGFNYATVPSVLVETGFMSNPVDDRQLADTAYQDTLADAIARGVLQYLGVSGQ